jgi:hypothetical protein
MDLLKDPKDHRPERMPDENLQDGQRPNWPSQGDDTTLERLGKRPQLKVGSRLQDLPFVTKLSNYS